MLPSDDDCDDCIPDYLKDKTSSKILSTIPFLVTFLVVASLVLKRLYPLLSGSDSTSAGNNGSHEARVHGFENGNQVRGKGVLRTLWRKLEVRRVAPLVFATNIGLSAVLVELILCEISNALNPSARRLALNLTLPTLMFLLIVVAPALELRAVIASTGLAFNGTGKGRLRVAWFFEGLGLVLWLLGFWYIGHGLLGLYLREETLHWKSRSFSEGCLERIGIIGISLMASLSGFAAVSALWQTFGVRDKPVSESDISRKQAGLEATNDMLGTKRSRLRAVERKLADTRDESVVTRWIGSLRGSTDTQERTTLELEVSGLETMRLSLQNTLYTLRNRRASQLRAYTAVGRLLITFSYGFALYCAFRLGNTTLNIIRRSIFSSVSSSSTDPVTNLLAYVARHWDPTLNQAMWSRQISFLLSGFMLLLAFNSALQTFLLLARAFPSLLSAAFGGANFALLVSQVCASYVISSALLLRSNLPSEVGGVISDALGAPLETSKVDAWFEAWFMGASFVTVVGIWVGRKLRGPGEWDDDGYGNEGDLELGKRN
ncbi:hypothetical protein EJ08DRAFT_649026 [Tothia fuscella]|uniref:Abscisic acid G-protein coupled receptor-like domain-containing protein n=1 Tax=Tothia fuscella TaxID=1048955 RepID=A0A9P4NS93_9PEZI|nr:hypothetical protein EJ08DRAFT_649026 [Tothia fuscella]